MNVILKRVMCYLIGCILTACTPFISGEAIEPQPSSTVELNSPTRTSSFNTPTVTMELNETVYPVADATESTANEMECKEFRYLDRSKLNTEGILILDSNTNDSPSILYDIADQEVIDFGSNNYQWREVITSLDLTSVAMRVYDVNQSKSSLMILNNQAEIVSKNPWQEHFGHLSYWLLNGNIVIETTEDQPATLLELDYHTNSFNRLSRDNLIDFDTIPNLEGWFQTGWTIYSPDMRQVFYPRINEWVRDIVLYDLENESIVTSIDYMFPMALGAVEQFWSRDGSRMAMRIIKNTILIVQPDGKYKEIHLLEDYFPDSWIDNLTWSPDGRFLSFWIIPANPLEVDKILGILDVSEEIFTSYCVYFPQTNYDYYSFVWSPNGQYLAVERWRGESVGTVILDLLKGNAYPLLENYMPRAWLISPNAR